MGDVDLDDILNSALDELDDEEEVGASKPPAAGAAHAPLAAEAPTKGQGSGCAASAPREPPGADGAATSCGVVDEGKAPHKPAGPAGSGGDGR
jgi:hypothetical protein